MVALIDSISSGVPEALVEIAKLGRTLKKRADDILAYFDRPHTSNGPSEAISSHRSCSRFPHWDCCPITGGGLGRAGGCTRLRSAWMRRAAIVTSSSGGRGQRSAWA